MMQALSDNARAILLLTAPLDLRANAGVREILTPAQYKKLARFLFDHQQEPADLLDPAANELRRACSVVVEAERLERLLGRGFLLTQAVERWQARAIWVVTRADHAYPRRLRDRLKDAAPPMLHGCGDAALLDGGGLAVVGSRNVDAPLLAYTAAVARLASEAATSIVSGGARGIDQAAMRGALDAGGKAIGVLADSLQGAVIDRGYRDALLGGRLVLVSPYDPAVGFNVGQAMQRNKLDDPGRSKNPGLTVRSARIMVA